MSDERRRIFRLLETADNFIKYAPGDRKQRAAARAGKRYEKALALARRIGDSDLERQATLRIEDLERRASLPSDGSAETDRSPGIETADVPEHALERVPPGQRLKRGWPVLHVGPVPVFDTASWRLTIRGEVERTVELTYDELKALPDVEMQADFHCVTGWSKLDNFWRGVRAQDVLDLAGPAPGASNVTVHGEYGYTANLPLDALRRRDCLLAWGHNGSDLSPKHGYPLRLVVPQLYGWKSVKWVRSLELTHEDVRGFWEVRGYHNRADPWLEERYSYQES